MWGLSDSEMQSFLVIIRRNYFLLAPILTELGSKVTLFDDQQTAIREQFTLCRGTFSSISLKFVARIPNSVHHHLVLIYGFSIIGITKLLDRQSHLKNLQLKGIK